jgi:ribosomal protein S18 acetylase RimI-like enzyme
VLVDLAYLATWEDALTIDIRRRAKHASKCGLTKQYSIIENGTEVGYLALDWWPHDQCSDLVLYEIFVPEQFRHRGVGSRTLTEAEKLARSHGYSRVLLIARPLEDYPKERLVAWYQKHGFSSVPHPSGDAMAKNV